MIKTEYLHEGTLIKHYSDNNKMLLQNETGIHYADPVDIVPCPYTYTETDIDIEADEEPIEEELDHDWLNEENIEEHEVAGSENEEATVDTNSTIEEVV